MHYLAGAPEPGTATSDTDAQPKSDQVKAPERLKVVVRDQNGASMDVVMKLDAPLSKVMKKFSALVGRQQRLCRFFYNGPRVLDGHTPTTVSCSTVGSLSKLSCFIVLTGVHILVAGNGKW